MSDELQRFYENKLKDSQSHLTAAEARVKELEKLKEYMKHHGFCRLAPGQFFNPMLGCTCGLDNLRAELDKLKGKL